MVNDNSLLASLEKEKISKLIFKFSIPSLAIVAVSGSYNIIDGIFLGRKLGVVGNTVNGYVLMLYMVLYAISTLVSQGASAILTISLGKKDYTTVDKIMGITVFLSLLISIAQSILIYLNLDNIIWLFGIEKNYSEYFRSYFNVYLFCAPIYFLSHSLMYCLRAQGKMVLVMLLNLLSFIVNAILGFFFIIILDYGFPGSAMATVGANLVSCIICICIYIKKDSQVRIKRKEIRWNASIGLEILKSGMSFLFLNLSTVFLLLFYNQVAKKYAGDFGLATLSIVSSIYRYITIIMTAIANGIQPIIGYNYGAKNYKRVKETVNFTLIISSIICLVLEVLIQVNALNIINLYDYNNTEFTEFAVKGIRLVLLAVPLQGLIAISISYYQNIKKSNISLTLVVLRQVVFQVPLAIALPYFFNIGGLWDSFWISDVLISIVIAILLLRPISVESNNKGLLKRIHPVGSVKEAVPLDHE